MKWFFPVLVGMIAAFLGYALWTAFLEDPGPKGLSPRSEQGPGGEAAEESGEDPGKAPAAAQGNLPAWAQAGGVLMNSRPKTRWDGLPTVIGELEFLTFGRDKYAANTPELKLKLEDLRRAMADMTPEEEKLLAEYFRACEDPAMKYYLMASFRSWGGEAYVDAIAEYYEADPDMVGEALQHLIGRTPRAAEAMERLIEAEVDPLRRARLVARAGYLGAPAVREMMEGFFQRRNSVERRLAVPALAKIPDEEAHQVLFDLIEGDSEDARYLPEENIPREKEFRDLRCHAVLALLQNGSPKEIERLLRRAQAGDEDDQVASYIRKYFAVVESPAWVEQVVNDMVDRQSVSKSLLLYLNRRARPEDVPRLQKLRDLEMDEVNRRILEDTLNRLR